MLTQTVLTRPTTKRIVLGVPIDALHRVLTEFDESQFTLEHVYDY
jgi:hypothetical protein